MYMFVRCIPAVVAVTIQAPSKQCASGSFLFLKAHSSGAAGDGLRVCGVDGGTEKCEGLRLGQKDKWAKRKEKIILETSVRRAQRPWYLGETTFVCLLIHKPSY